MRDSSTRSFKPVNSNVRFERERKRRRRNLITVAIIAVSVIICVFVVLIFGELFGWFNGCEGEKDPGGDKGKITFEFTDIYAPIDIHEGDLILINSSFPFVFPDTAPALLSTYTNRNKYPYINDQGKETTAYTYYTQSGEGAAKLEANTLKALNSLADDFFKATNNIDLFIFDEDGYRSSADQQAKYDKYISHDTQLVYAPAGESEHHTGKCVDLYVYTSDGVRGNLDDDEFYATFKWIYDNAYKYGFILRYPSAKSSITSVNYEPYHFRNVGYAHAYYMTQNNLCLEEYLDKVRDEFSFENGGLKFTGDDGANYMIYYAAKSPDGLTSIKVPSEDAVNEGIASYTISGDNKDGYIITVKYSAN